MESCHLDYWSHRYSCIVISSCLQNARSKCLIFVVKTCHLGLYLILHRNSLVWLIIGRGSWIGVVDMIYSELWSKKWSRELKLLCMGEWIPRVCQKWDNWKATNFCIGHPDHHMGHSIENGPKLQMIPHAPSQIWIKLGEVVLLNKISKSWKFQLKTYFCLWDILFWKFAILPPKIIFWVQFSFRPKLILI